MPDLRSYMKFCPHFIDFSSDLVVRRYRKIYTELCGVPASLESAQWKPYPVYVDISEFISVLSTFIVPFG
jgi:hypothetical protein